MIPRVTAIKPYPVSARRPVPAGIPHPHYVDRPGPERYTGSHVQTADTIERMRIAGRIAAQAMAAGAAVIAPGVTTDEIDEVVHDFIVGHGAYPSTLGYRGFPKSCCTSVNEVICHGIPDARPLEDGDLVVGEPEFVDERPTAQEALRAAQAGDTDSLGAIATSDAAAQQSGLYYVKCAVATPTPVAADAALAQALWTASEGWTEG